MLNYQNSLGEWYRMRFLSIVRIADDERKRAIKDDNDDVEWERGMY